MKELKIGDKVICIKEKKRYKLGKYYEIVYASGRYVSVQTDYHIGISSRFLSYSFYIEVHENECYECLWDYFDLLKDIRKKKLKKLKLINASTNLNLYP